MPTSEYISGIRAKIGKDLLILPGTSAVVINEDGQVLLKLRSDRDVWTILCGLPARPAR